MSRLARSTKIVATLGPATSSPERVAALIAAGVDVVRLNFSHGSYDEHREAIARVRSAAAELRAPVALLQDLQGPKIRTGSLVDGKAVELLAGSSFRIRVDREAGDSHGVSTTYPALPHDVKPGDRILLGRRVGDSAAGLHLVLGGTEPLEQAQRVEGRGGFDRKQTLIQRYSGLSPYVSHRNP